MVPEAAAMAGPRPAVGLRGAGHPPGTAHGELRRQQPGAACWRRRWPTALGVDIDQLPLAGAAPEWYSEKAVAIGAYVVASGITTVLGVQPAIFGSPHVVDLLAGGLDDVVGRQVRGRARPGRGRAVDPPPHRGQAPRASACPWSTRAPIATEPAPTPDPVGTGTGV